MSIDYTKNSWNPTSIINNYDFSLQLEQKIIDYLRFASPLDNYLKFE